MNSPSNSPPVPSPSERHPADTENATVVKTVLADLVDLGLRAKNGLLVVNDGSKALRPEWARLGLVGLLGSLEFETRRAGYGNPGDRGIG